MNLGQSYTARPIVFGYVLMAALAISGCSTFEANVAAGALGATALAAQSPNNEIEQIYYLGVFDPQEQLPPMVYRVRVHGQSSFMSNTKFSSGWVNARLVDSLGSNITVDKDSGQISIEQATDPMNDPLKTGRRLMLFGPEGFREAPAGHRLVIVMGTTPEKWFEAMDQALQAVGEAISDQRTLTLNSDIVELLNLAKAERAKLAALQKAILPSQSSENSSAETDSSAN